MRVNIEDGAASRAQWKIHAGGKSPLVVAQESDTYRPPDTQRHRLVLDHRRQWQHAAYALTPQARQARY